MILKQVLANIPKKYRVQLQNAWNSIYFSLHENIWQIFKENLKPVTTDKRRYPQNISEI